MLDPTKLAEAIRRDLTASTGCAEAAPALTGGKPTECFACRRSFVYRHPKEQTDRNPRFCSINCQDVYDRGGPVVREPTIRYAYRDGRPMKARGQGFEITCAGCRREFVSKGLRCCSAECEHEFQRRESLAAEIAESGVRIEGDRRRCESCGINLPLWRKGRKLSSATKFCSPKCWRKGRRAVDPCPDDPPGVFVIEIAQKCLQNGPSRSAASGPATSAERPDDRSAVFSTFTPSIKSIDRAMWDDLAIPDFLAREPPGESA